MERFGLSMIQATAILDLRLSQLTALESDAIKQEHADMTERIRELREILGDEDARARAHQGGARSRSPSASATSAARRSRPPRTSSTSRT